MAQRHRVAEPGPRGHLVHALPGVLEQPLGQQDPLPGDPAQRRGAGLLNEPPGERPRRHVLRAADGDCAPDTYAGFLWRSSVALWHEPSAWRRAAGARPRR